MKSFLFFLWLWAALWFIIVPVVEWLITGVVTADAWWKQKAELVYIYELLLHWFWKINTGKDKENMAGWYLIKELFQRPESPLLWRQELTGSTIQSISICALRQSHILVTIYLLKFIFSFAFLLIHRSLSLMFPELLAPCGLIAQLLVLWSSCAKGTQRLWKWWLEVKLCGASGDESPRGSSEGVLSLGSTGLKEGVNPGVMFSPFCGKHSTETPPKLSKHQQITGSWGLEICRESLL